MAGARLCPALAALCMWLATGAGTVLTGAVTERDVERAVVADPLLDKNASNKPPWTITTREITLENEYLRIVALPLLGGRIAEVFDKTSGKQMFAVRPIEWPPTRYIPYGSQLGGIEINFPCFHHGNNFMDQWNWLAREEPDGTATLFMGWTDKDSRQRVVARFELRPGENMMRCRYRFVNLNVFSSGFAPFINTLPVIRSDLRYIWPAQHVVPHGFNNGNLDVLPWPWPDFNRESVCYWRNIPREYASVFGLLFEENFHGLYYEEADYGMVRLFDRLLMPGVKLWNNKGRQDEPNAFLEIWHSPCLLMEDALWWEALAVREYEDVFYPVHGIGGYRRANEHGALNLDREESLVRVGVFVTRPVKNAIVTLSGAEGLWWRTTLDLAPDKPLSHVVKRMPGRAPLDLQLSDERGNLLIRFEQRPDPAPISALSFTGSPMWSATPEQRALYEEQYHPLWRGPTGGYRGYGSRGIAAWRKLLEADPGHAGARLGLARSLLMDAQLRRPEKPAAGTAESIADMAREYSAEALSVLQPMLSDPRAATLAAETHLRLGDPKSAVNILKKVSGDSEAAFVLAKAYAAMGEFRQGREAIKPALRALPDSPPVVQLAAGLAALNGDHSGALLLLDRLYELDPLDPVTVQLRAVSLAAAGGKEGEAAARKALAALEKQINDPLSQIVADEALVELGLSAPAK